MFKSILAGFVVSAISVSAYAGDKLPRDVLSVERAISDFDYREKWINAPEDKVENRLNSVHRYVDLSSNVNVKGAEELILDVMRHHNRFNGEWSGKTKFIDNEVFVDDKLIDLDRPQIGWIEFGLVETSYTVQLDPRSENREVGNNHLSKTMMRNGLPAIGPDGAKIRLCRLVDHEDASFYELSETKSVDFVNGSYSNMNLQEACIMYPGALDRHWKGRYRSFIDENGVETK